MTLFDASTLRRLDAATDASTPRRTPRRPDAAMPRRFDAPTPRRIDAATDASTPRRFDAATLRRPDAETPRHRAATPHAAMPRRSEATTRRLGAWNFRASFLVLRSQRPRCPPMTPEARGSCAGRKVNERESATCNLFAIRFLFFSTRAFCNGAGPIPTRALCQR